MPGGGFDGEALAIISRFDTQWLAGPHLAIPVAYPNVKFDKPSEGSTFVALFILGGAGVQDMAISTDTPVEFTGIVSVQIMTPLAQGNKEAREIAHWIATNIFDRAQFSSGNSGTITMQRSQIVNERASATHARYLQTDLDTVYQRRVNG